MPNFFLQSCQFIDVPRKIYRMEWTVIFIAILFNTAPVQGARDDYEADYHTNVSLPCNFTFHNLSYPGIAVPFLRYWILPNTSVIADNSALDERVKIVSPDQYTFNLFIAWITDEDYGVYHCFMIWNNINYQSSVIRVGLNEDGPYYKEKLEQFERNVLIGCIAAGGVVLIVFIGCIVCRCRRKKNESSGQMSDLDYYSTPTDGQSRQKSQQYQINTTINDGETTSSANQKSVEEMYAKVNKQGMTSRPESVTVQSEHL